MKHQRLDCGGRFRIIKHARYCQIWSGKDCSCYIRKRTYVAAHEFPVFVQCSGCGFAPVDNMLITFLGRLLRNIKCRR